MRKLSESVYRSPKCLQRFGDFELRTGEDIKSEKQKERIRKQEEQQRKEREEKERQEWLKKEMTRKEEREYSKNRKFPYAISYEVTPCKWESMEFIKEITSMLKEMNLNLNI